MDSSTSKRVSQWILEFLIRNPDAEELAKRALAVLPIPNHEDDDPRLKKTVLLRTVECELLDATVTEATLDALELIEDLDSRLGVDVGDAVKAAYCAVAVECTVRLLVGAGGKPGTKYLGALKRIWRARVCRLEERKSRLLTSELRQWRDDVEAAVWDAGVCEKLMGFNTRNDALASLRVYMKEAWALAGNSVIGWAVRLSDEGEEEKVMTSREGEPPDRGTGLSDVIELAKKAGLVSLGGDGDDQVRDKVVILPGSPADVVLNDTLASNAEEIPGTNVAVQNKDVSRHRRRRGPVKISDIEDSDKETSGRKCSSIKTPAVSILKEALKSSSLELQRAVTDPLPGALRVAETVISNLTMKNVIHRHPVENQSVGDVHVANISVEKSTEPVESRKANLGNPSCSHQNNVPRPSLMERNSTAHTEEWNDSIDGSPQVKLMSKTRINLPSPKKRVVSPLSTYKPTKFCKRRSVRRWTLLEEDTLRTGVIKFGKGNWKLILNNYRDIFDERTEVDLKDKWRNITR